MHENSSKAPSWETDADDSDADFSEDQDARAELRRLAGELREATLHVVWRQWRALGAGASGRSTKHSSSDGRTRRHLRALIDPEALVLISLALVPYERRLADILHDWAAQNSDMLSVQRMKNLEARYPEPVRRQLNQGIAWFAAVSRDAGKDHRWRAVASAWAAMGESEGAKTGVETNATDDVFAANGPELRSPVRSLLALAASARQRSRPKKRATRARLNEGASLLLRLRLGVGVGIKADLLAFLLCRSGEWASIREIADATGYSPAAVRRAAEDLAAARMIESLDGQPTSYRAVLAAWAPLLAIAERPPQWASWHERFLLVAAFQHWEEVARDRPLSRYAFGVHGRELLEQHRSALSDDMEAAWGVHSPVNDWATFVKQSVQSLAAWMEEMA